jgi:hypothetical protein
MADKKVASNKKVLDVSRPKKRTKATGTAAPALIIPKRAVIPITEVQTEPDPEPMQPRHIARSIKPTTAPEVDVAIETPDLNTEEQGFEPVKVATSVEKSPTTATSPSPKLETPEVTEKAPDADTSDPATDTVATPDDEQESTETKAHPDVREALEEARRQQEIQGYITKHEFFVPINAVARKRSIKVTLLLVVLELLLGLFLLNLMLDAGLIYLLQKIPHTNFFNLH